MVGNEVAQCQDCVEVPEVWIFEPIEGHVL